VPKRANGSPITRLAACRRESDRPRFRPSDNRGRHENGARWFSESPRKQACRTENRSLRQAARSGVFVKEQADYLVTVASIVVSPLICQHSGRGGQLKDCSHCSTSPLVSVSSASCRDRYHALCRPNATVVTSCRTRSIGSHPLTNSPSHRAFTQELTVTCTPPYPTYTHRSHGA